MIVSHFKLTVSLDVLDYKLELKKNQPLLKGLPYRWSKRI